MPKSKAIAPRLRVGARPGDGPQVQVVGLGDSEAALDVFVFL